MAAHWRRVTGKRGAVVREGLALDTPEVAVLPLGTRVLVEERSMNASGVARCRLGAPASGYCSAKALSRPLEVARREAPEAAAAAPERPPPPTKFETRLFVEAQLQTQADAWRELHGTAWSAADRAKTSSILDALAGLLFRTSDRLGDVDWEAVGGLAASGRAAPCDATFDGADAAKARGCGVFARRGPGGRVEPLVAAVRRLAAAGWPPAFLLVFDDVWTLLDGCFAVAAELLGGDVVLESDVNCWALRAGAPRENYVGRGFSAPHRDLAYDRCHDADGAPQSLSLWVPLTAATRDNGCMRVVARGAADGTALVAGAGDVCCWEPSLLHWAGACEAGEVPRVSIGATFRRADAPASRFGGPSAADPSRAGPPPASRAAARDLPLATRLSYVAKALVAYAHWYPGFPGFDALHRC